MSKGNTKAQNIVSTHSAESILIPLGFKWIQIRSSCAVETIVPQSIEVRCATMELLDWIIT